MERTPWAQAQGIDARSLHSWWLALERRKKHERGLTRSSVRFVKVVAEPAQARASRHRPALARHQFGHISHFGVKSMDPSGGLVRRISCVGNALVFG